MRFLWKTNKTHPMKFCHYFLSGLMYKHSKGNLKKDPVNGSGWELQTVDANFNQETGRNAAST